MEIGNNISEVVGQVTQESMPQPRPEMDVKQRFDKQMSFAKVTEVQQPSVRDIAVERGQKSTEIVDILKEVSEINAHISIMQSSLQLTVDQGSGRNVITVMDKGTGELIRQIPSAEVLKMSARIRHYMESMQQQIQQGKQMDLKGLLYEGKS